MKVITITQNHQKSANLLKKAEEKGFEVLATRRVGKEITELTFTFNSDRDLVDLGIYSEDFLNRTNDDYVPVITKSFKYGEHKI